MLSGVTELNMTKSDVLTHFDTLRVCTAYKINGKEIEELPFDINLPVEPVYTGNARLEGRYIKNEKQGRVAGRNA